MISLQGSRRLSRVPALAVLDKVALVCVVALFGVFRPDVVLFAAYILLWPYLFLTSRRGAMAHLVLASVVAVVWVVLARHVYGYNIAFGSLFGVSLFPLFAWALGLFSVYVLYAHWSPLLRRTTWAKRALLFTVLYVPLLLLGEWLGYHVFGIQNVATGMYAALPLCNCMHAPVWMQVAYFFLGPLYFALCEVLGLESPNTPVRLPKHA